MDDNPTGFPDKAHPGPASPGGGPRFEFPRSAAELFGLLALIGDELPLEALLASLDYRHTTLSRLYRLVHRRLPENFAALADAADTPMAQHLQAGLLSDEFQEKVIEHVLAAFALMPRTYGIMPDAIAPVDEWRLVPPFHLPLDPALGDIRWTSKPALIAALGLLAARTPHVRGLFLPNVTSLADLMTRSELRAQDRIRVLLQDPAERMQRRAAREAARRGCSVADVLRDPALCPPNPLCRSLALHGEADYAAAIDAIVTHDIEFVAADRLRRDPGLHQMHDPALAAVIGQDLLLTRVLLWGLGGRDTTDGSELLQRAGRRLQTSLPRRLMQPASLAPPNPIVATSLPNGRQWLANREPFAAGALDIGFRADGHLAACLVEGWSGLEDGYVWTNGFRAILGLPRPARAADHVLLILCEPFTAPERPSQEIELALNGEVLALARLAEASLLRVRLPWSLLARKATALIELDLPDAARPAELGEHVDTRLLGICVHRIVLEPDPQALEAVPSGPGALPPDHQLMLHFESLGENCEFGLVQRRCGAEPLGMLRFASAPYENLCAALRDRLAEVGRPDLIEIEDNGREFMVHDLRYGFLYHAWVNTGEKSASEVHQREARRLPFLVRKLREDLTEGEKIFVFHGMSPLSKAEASSLADLLGGFGPCTLLWVELADDSNPPGSVVRVADNLLAGFVDRFAPGEDAKDISLACWTTVCRNAYRLWRDVRRPREQHGI